MIKRIISTLRPIAHEYHITDMDGAIATVTILSHHDAADDGLDYREHLMVEQDGKTITKLDVAVTSTTKRDFERSPPDTKYVWIGVQDAWREFLEAYFVEIDDYDFLLRIESTVHGITEGIRGDQMVGTVTGTITDVSRHISAAMRNHTTLNDEVIVERVALLDYSVCFNTACDGQTVPVDYPLTHSVLHAALRTADLQKLYGAPKHPLHLYDYGIAQLTAYLKGRLINQPDFCMVDIEVFQIDQLWVLKATIPDDPAVAPIILGNIQLS